MAKKFKAMVYLGNAVKSVTGLCVDAATSANLKTAIEAISKGVVKEIYFAGADDIFTTAIPTGSSTDKQVAQLIGADSATSGTCFLQIPFAEAIPTQSDADAFKTLLSVSIAANTAPDTMSLSRMKKG